MAAITAATTASNYPYWLLIPVMTGAIVGALILKRLIPAIFGLLLLNLPLNGLGWMDYEGVLVLQMHRTNPAHLQEGRETVFTQLSLPMCFQDVVMIHKPNAKGERPPPTVTVKRTMRPRTADQRRAEKRGGGSSPPTC